MIWIVFAFVSASCVLSMCLQAATGHPWLACLECFNACLFALIAVAEYIEAREEE